jgi:hypothetical protein
MPGFQPSRLLPVAAVATLVLTSGGVVSGAPKITKGISITINGQGPFTYSSDGAAKQFKDRGYIVQGSTQPDVYKFTIPRTAKTGLDKLAWKSSVPCAGTEALKVGAAAEGFLEASSPGKISLRAG